jgi:hypothetical protein
VNEAADDPETGYQTASIAASVLLRTENRNPSHKAAADMDKIAKNLQAFIERHGEIYDEHGRKRNSKESIPYHRAS